MNPTPSEPMALETGVPPGVIRWLGVGGAGVKFIELLAVSGFETDSLAVLGSDEAQLRQSLVPRKLLLQSRLLRGLGSSGDPDLGRAAAEELAAPIKSLCAGAGTVVIITGLGGGTGSGAAPVVARLARETGALTLAFAVLPFDCEGRRKQSQALAGLEQLKAAADGVLCLRNQRLFATVTGGRTLMDAFRSANDCLLGGVQSLRQLLTRRGLIDLKPATLVAALRGRHAESAFATVSADGTGRAQALLDRVLTHPMLDGGRALAEADTVLVNLTGGPDLGMDEVQSLMDKLQEQCGAARLHFGAAIEENFAGRLELTVIATQRRVMPEQPADGAGDSMPAPAARIPEGSFDSAMGTTFLDTGEAERAPSRVLPPPPELTQEKRWEVLQQQSPQRGRGSRPARMKQGQLPLQIVSKGRFDKTETTYHNGEDLDLPTYLRRGVALN